MVGVILTAVLMPHTEKVLVKSSAASRELTITGPDRQGDLELDFDFVDDLIFADADSAERMGKALIDAATAARLKPTRKPTPSTTTVRF